ncbi:MAG: lytic transglycosylase domain-containing protein [Pseudomonadota bacterium]
MKSSVLGAAVCAGLSIGVTGCQTAGLESGTSTFAGSLEKPAKPSSRKGKPYEAIIRKHAKANGVPVELALAVVQVESSFNPKARGAAGEVGLMQIKPATARGMGYSGSVKSLYNPETNIKWGMKYLGGARAKSDGSTCGTILKYNAGHYAKRMNKVSANYCRKIKRII